MAKDRVGIVAGISQKTAELKGTLKNISQTVMHHYFTMMLIAAFPDHYSEKEILDALESVEELSGANIRMTAYQPSLQSEECIPQPENQYILTASGPDNIGLVAAATAHLRERNINIIDLTTSISDNNYIMMFLIQVPEKTDIGKLKHSLQLQMNLFKMKVELRHQALFQRTNDI